MKQNVPGWTQADSDEPRRTQINARNQQAEDA